MQNTFGKSIIPDNDEERLARLMRYHVLDTFNDGDFKHIVTMAAHMFKVPIALVSLVYRDQVLFKGNFGMEGIDKASRGESMCSLAVLHDGVTVFENTKSDPCLLTNPLVAGEFGMRFYAGAPLKTPEGFNIGTICIIDKKQRKFTEADELLLNEMASLVMDELEKKL